MKMKINPIAQWSAPLCLSAALPIMAQTPGSPHAAAAKPNDPFRPRGRHLLYVALPGSLEQPGWLNGVGIVVLDANDNYRFVKRIPTWEYAGSMSPEQVSGMAANPVATLIYVAARGRLAAIDMGTDKMVWSVTLDGKCCERPQVPADGKN